MIVSSPLFQAYLECPTKCWLRFHAEPATGNVYAEWTRAENNSYRLDALNRLHATFATREQTTAPCITKQSQAASWRLAIDVKLYVNGFDSHVHAVERMPAPGGQKTGRFVPYHFLFSSDRHVIVKVQLSSLIKKVRRRIKDVTALLANNSPPDLVLNRQPACRSA